MSSEFKQAHGQQVLRFFIEHGYILDEELSGQASICRTDVHDSLADCFNIPHEQYLPESLLKDLLEPRGLSVEQFWEWEKSQP